MPVYEKEDGDEDLISFCLGCIVSPVVFVMVLLAIIYTIGLIAPIFMGLLSGLIDFKDYVDSFSLDRLAFICWSLIFSHISIGFLGGLAVGMRLPNPKLYRGFGGTNG